MVALALLSGFGWIRLTATDGGKTVSSGKSIEDPQGLELTAQSSPFIQLAPIGVETNQIWGRPIPGRVALQVAARATVGAVVEGQVEQVLVRPGDKVKAGDPLLKIHSAGGGQARAEAEQALARLNAAEESLRRYTVMAEKGIATELEKFEAELHAREARIDVERTRGATSLLGAGDGVQFFITAPTNGVILSISVANGSALQPGNDVIEIGDPSKVWIEAEVGDEEAAEVTPGQLASIAITRTGKTLSAKVETVSGQVDPVTRRHHIYLGTDADSVRALAPGRLVDVRLAEPPNQLRVPVEAVLIKEGDRRIVYVEGVDGRLHARDVLINTPAEGHVRVTQGLVPGERIVVKGALLLDGRSEQLL